MSYVQPVPRRVTSLTDAEIKADADGNSSGAVLLKIGSTAKLTVNNAGNTVVAGALTLGTDLAVSEGGTGASTLTGLVKGNGASAFTAVTAPTGDVVGTSDSQTLTNKTLTTPTVNQPVLNLADGTAPTAEGSIVWDATADLLKVGTGAATKTAVDTNSTQTLSSKTLTAPTIADFTNATHNHEATAGGGTVSITAATTGTLTVARGGTGAVSFTAGALLFGNTTSALSVDATNLFWDDTNNRLGLGTGAPDNTLHIAGTLKLVDGNQAADKILVSNSAGLATWQTLGTAQGTQIWTKFTVTKDDAIFTAAATSASKTIFTLSAGGIIHFVKIKHSEAFDDGVGSITSVTTSLGISGNATKYAAAFNIQQAAANDTLQLSTITGTENHGAGTAIVATFTSDSNFGDGAATNLTTGSVDFWVLTSVAT